jgi:hypothetical protein
MHQLTHFNGAPVVDSTNTQTADDRFFKRSFLFVGHPNAAALSGTQRPRHSKLTLETGCNLMKVDDAA